MATLRFRADGTFTVAQFTDLHWCNGEPEDLQTSALLAAVIDAERPDLAVFTGDVIAGRPCRDPAAAWRGAVEPCVRRGLPWAFVFGNHDDEGALDRRALMEVARGCPGCLAEAGPDGLGVGNYRLEVLAPAGDRAAATLCFVDSGSYAPEAVGGYTWIRHEQLAWYRGEAAASRRRHGAVLPALTFFHIPLPEWRELWGSRACRGVRYEEVCCPRLNSGFFTALLEAEETVAAFVGHDHINDYHGELHGIGLYYGRASGFHTYGRAGMPRGARLIRLRAGSRGIESWLRLEGGAVVREQPEHAPGAD